MTKLRLVSLLSLVLVLAVGGSVNGLVGEWANGKEISRLARNDNDGAVLAAHDETDENAFATDVHFEVNIPAVFNDTVRFTGESSFENLTTTSLVTSTLVTSTLETSTLVVASEITAPNILYSLTGTDGLEITGDQELTITNIDKGSSQNIFKNFKVGSDTAAAGSNTDTFEFVQGTNIGLSLDTGSKKLTISNTFTLPTQPWTLTGTSVHLSDITTTVDIASDLTVDGNTVLNGDVTLGSSGTSTVIFNGRLGSGTSLLPSTDLGADLGSASYRFNNIYVANINTNGSLSTAGQAIFTYEPTTTAYTESSVLINPTSPVANGYLLGLGVGGYQRAGFDEDGDLSIGYNDAVSAPTSDYPLNIYGHNGTRVSYVDTTGAGYFAGNVGIGTTSPDATLEVKRDHNVSSFTGDQSSLLRLNSVEGSEYAILGFTGYATAYNDRNLAQIGAQYTGSGSYLHFGTSNTYSGITNTAMSIRYDGNVGIGTTSPAGQLHVSTANTSPQLSLQLTNTQYNSGSIRAYTKADAAGTALTFNGTPTFTSTNITDLTKDYPSAVSGRSAWAIETTSSDKFLVHSKNSDSSGLFSTPFAIDINGNVGIGTTTMGSFEPTTWNGNTNSKRLEVAANGTYDAGLFLGRNDTTTRGLDVWHDGSGGSSYFDNRWNDNTGNIYFRTKTNGTPVNALTILGSGNVGIGSTAPGYKLDVNGLTFTQALYVPGNASFQTPAIRVGGYSGSASSTGLGVYGTSEFNNSLYLATLGGSVGIGTTSPTSLLHVTGKITGKALAIFNETGDQSIFTASASGVTKFSVANNGSVGVAGLSGTVFASSYSGVGINASNLTTGYKGFTVLNDSNQALAYMGAGFGGTGIGQFVLRSGGTASVAIQAGQTSYIDYAGSANFGLGTSSPDATLHVFRKTAGWVTPDNVLILQTDSGFSAANGAGTAMTFKGRSSSTSGRDMALISAIWSNATDANRTSDLAVSTVNNAGSLAEVFRITGAGYVGIGTTAPTSLLHLEGKVTGKALAIFNETGNQDIFAASASGTNRFVITNAGNVGIGTSSPTTMLQLANTNSKNIMSISNAGDPVITLGTASDNTYSPRINMYDGANGINVYYRHNNLHYTVLSSLGIKNHYDGNEVFEMFYDAGVQTAGGGLKFEYGTRNSVYNNATYPSTIQFFPRGQSSIVSLYLNELGNVGIGTIAPRAKLEVVGDLRTNSATISGTYAGNVGLTIDALNDADSSIVIKEAGTTKWTVFNNGDNTDSFDITDAEGDQGVTLAQGATSWAAASDLTLKENVNLVEGSLDKVKSLRGVYYNFIGNSRTEVGLIAQEVQAVLPELVVTNKNGKLAVMYDRLAPVLVNAINDQQVQIDSLGNVTSLEQRLTAVETTNTEQDTEISNLKSVISNLFKNTVEFLADVTIKGRILVSGDQAGSITIPAGTSITKITFTKTLPVVPVITLTPDQPLPAGYYLKNITQDQFTIELPQALDHDVTINWTAALKDSSSNSPTVEFITPDASPTVTTSPSPATSPSTESAPVASESAFPIP